MEELEDPTEKLKEIQESAEEMFEQKERWTMHVALSTAVIAVIAAIAGLVGSHHANEGMLEQIKASDSWAFYQAKSIKAEITTSTNTMLVAMGKPADSKLAEKMAKYEKDKEDIKKEAEKAQGSSGLHMRQHVVFAKSITVFQIAIAISAISILTRKKLLWHICLGLSAIGVAFLVMGFLTH
jgi:hypothetical protein